jgi:hypothetical protein
MRLVRANCDVRAGASITSHLRQIVAPFQRALVDPFRHGMGKSLLEGLDDIGMAFDPNDPSSIADLMATFNSLSFEERGAILGLDGTGPNDHDPMRGLPIHFQRWVELATGLDLPPAHVLPRAQHENWLARPESPPSLPRLVRSLTWPGTPRKLTKIGNLSAADGKTLSQILHFGVASSRWSKERCRQRRRSRSALPSSFTSGPSIPC